MKLTYQLMISYHQPKGFALEEVLGLGSKVWGIQQLRLMAALATIFNQNQDFPTAAFNKIYWKAME